MLLGHNQCHIVDEHNATDYTFKSLNLTETSKAAGGNRDVFHLGVV